MPADSPLTALSNGFADAAERAAPAVVQVQGRRRPASGIVYAPHVVVTSARALGREDGLHVRSADQAVHDAELAGWDPATGLAVLRVAGLEGLAIEKSPVVPRVGHLALGIARSWSNALTASAGTIAVIGGPLATGRRQSIEEIIRTTAPMHDGFAGGAFVDTDGRAIGVCTAAAIRGLGVVIPGRIAWKTIDAIIEHGSAKRGYLGIAGQPVALPDAQQQPNHPAEALLVVGVTAGSPAAQGGVLVGDVMLEFDGHAVRSPEDLLELLQGDRVGRPAALHVLRGTLRVSLTVTVGERPTR